MLVNPSPFVFVVKLFPARSLNYGLGEKKIKNGLGIIEPVASSLFH